MPRTQVRASTVHNLFLLNLELESKVDPGKDEDPATQRLLRMTVLIIDEVSMLDDDAWRAIRDQLSAMGHRNLAGTGIAEKAHPRRDIFGRVHILLCGDYKQLPPATSRPPFIAMDHEVLQRFRFRVLRQNRRLASAERPEEQVLLDKFHQVLEDVAQGNATELVRQHIVEAYVRGARTTALNVSLDRGTACFTTRRFRDRWNNIVQARTAKKYGRSLKVKAEFTAATNPGRTIHGSAAKNIRRVVRSQSLLKLHLAGQWLQDPPLPMQAAPHFMRAMLVANKDVENRFANGTQGRIVWWSPNVENLKADAVSAADPEVTVRFVHEDAIASGQQEWLSGVDFIDLQPGTEEIPRARGKPNMLQLQAQPANALTIHKCQSLTIRDHVYGCLEGVFAHGQVYVLWSRVTQPQNFHLVGIPPTDLLKEVAEAWREAGLDVDECFAAATKVSNDWDYTRSKPDSDPTEDVEKRLRAKQLITCGAYRCV